MGDVQIRVPVSVGLAIVDPVFDRGNRAVLGVVGETLGDGTPSREVMPNCMISALVVPVFRHRELNARFAIGLSELAELLNVS